MNSKTSLSLLAFAAVSLAAPSAAQAQARVAFPNRVCDVTSY